MCVLSVCTHMHVFFCVTLLPLKLHRGCKEVSLKRQLKQPAGSGSNYGFNLTRPPTHASPSVWPSRRPI